MRVVILLVVAWPFADNRDIAVCSHDGRGQRLIGGAAIVVVIRELILKEPAELFTKLSVVYGGEELQLIINPRMILCAEQPFPLLPGSILPAAVPQPFVNWYRVVIQAWAGSGYGGGIKLIAA